MNEKRLKIAIKILSISLFVATLWSGDVAFAYIKNYFPNHPVLAVGAFFVFLFNIIGAIGIFKTKRWGLNILYISWLLSIFFNGNLYIPFISYLIPMNLMKYFYYAINILTLSALEIAFDILFYKYSKEATAI